MKTKLLAIVLSLLMLVQPVAAIGMVGMESAEEVSSVVEIANEEIIEEAELAGDYSAYPAIIMHEDFEGYTDGHAFNTAGTAFSQVPAYAKSGVTTKFQNGTAVASSKVAFKAVTVDGSKVLEISGVRGNNDVVGFWVTPINMAKAGTYKVTMDAKMVNTLAGNASAASQTLSLRTLWGQSSNPAMPESSINAFSDWAWHKFTYTYTVTENSDGTFNFVVTDMNGKSQTTNNVPAANAKAVNFQRYFGVNADKTLTAANTPVKVYIDNLAIVEVADATVTYTDGTNTLATVNAKTGDTITVGEGLSVNYTPLYTVNGEEVAAGHKLFVAGNTTINVAKYVPANIPAGAIVYEDFEGYVDGAAVFGNAMSYDVSTTATKTTLSPFYANAATSVVEELSDNSIAAVAAKGGKAFKITNRANNYSLLSFYLMNLPAKELGEYAVSFKIFAEDNGTFSNVIYLHYNGASSANTSTLPARGQWQTVTLYYDIEMVDGVKTCICKGFDGKANMTFALNGDNLYKAEIRYINSDVTVADKQAIYLDDICITQKVPATVTYVDEKGTTIKTVNANVGDEITLPNASGLGIAYSPIYTIGGQSYSVGDKVTLTGDLTVNVAKYIPTNIPAGAIIFDDFEGYDVGATAPNFAIYNTTGDANAFMFSPEGGALTIAEFDGSKVLKTTKKIGEYYNIGMYINNIPTVNVGRYEFSFDAYLVYDGTNKWDQLVTTNIVSGGNYYLNSAFGDKRHNNWNNYKIIFDVTEENGKKTCVVTYCNGNKKTIDVTGAYLSGQTHMYFTNLGVGSTQTYYMDNFTLKYMQTATVTYVDEAGATLKTVSALTGDVVTIADASDLGINYKAVYTVNGEKVKAGDSITLSTNVTVNVAKYVAENVPANAIFFENFEAYDVYEDTTTRFNDYAAYTAGQAAGAKVYETYDKGTQSVVTVNGSKVFKQSDSAEYSAGFEIGGIKLEEPGTYTLSFKYLVTLPEESTATKPQFFFRFMNTGTQLISDEWSRIYVTDLSGKEWRTYRKSFEIYYEDGVKKIRSGGNSAALPATGITALAGFYIPNGNHIGVTYYDDICLTYEYKAPAIVNTYFVTENDEEFAYTGHSEDGSIALPTAAQLGVDYEPCYTYNNNVYYAGQYLEFEEDTDIEFVVAKTDVIFIANGGATPDFATGEAKDAEIGGTSKDGAYECNYSNWSANVIADGLTLGTYGTYTFDYDVTLKDNAEFAVHTMLYNSTSHGDGVTSIAGTVVKVGTTHISHSVTIYEKDGAPYFKDRTGTEHPLDKFEYFPIVRAVAMGTDKSGKFYVDNYTISFTPYAPTLVNKASYRVKDEHGKVGPAGIRFASYVTDAQYDACAEYGFVVTRKEFIGDDYTKLNLDGVTVTANGVAASKNSDGVIVVAAAAYNGNVTRTYTHDGSVFGTEYMGLEETFFTGVLTGIPSGMENDVFVGRPYIKINGNIYYGNCIERCYNDFNAAQNA